MNHSKTPRPTEHPTTKDICWAAGLLEGEGHFRSNNGWSPFIDCTQKDRWVVDKLQALFGGNIHLQQEKYYSWRLAGDMGRGLMMTVFCLMSPRRKLQIIQALHPELEV